MMPPPAAVAIALVVAGLAVPGFSLPVAAQDLNCSDFPTQAAAQAEYENDTSDPNGLDGPIGPKSAGDPGIACEETFGVIEDYGTSGPTPETSQTPAAATAPVDSPAPAPAPTDGTTPPPVPPNPSTAVPADVMARVEGCIVIAISSRGVSGAGCPGVGTVVFRIPADAPPMHDTVIITPGAMPQPASSAAQHAFTLSTRSDGSGRNGSGQVKTQQQRNTSKAQATGANGVTKRQKVRADIASKKKHHRRRP